MKLERQIKTLYWLAGAVLVLGLIFWGLAFAWHPLGLAITAGIAVVTLVLTRMLGRRVPRGTVLEVDLDGGVLEKKGSDPLSLALHRNFVVVRDVVDALDRAAADARITGFVARIGNGSIQLGHAQEVRDAVHRFRAAGKKTVAFSETFSESGSATIDYYLAAAFETIYLQPNGMVSATGLVGRNQFVRGLFDKLGIFPDLDHRKEYKAALYRLTETGFTEPHRQAVEGIAGEQFRQVVTGISTDRGITEERARELVDGSPLMTDEALEKGMVDQLGYRDEAYAAAGGDRFLLISSYLKRAGRPHRKGAKLGLIYGTGAIVRGGSGFDALTQEASMGADDVAKAFRAAIDERKVKAIVFRVDSPGGSAVGSEVVRREVVRARESGIPVVVSMSNVAGSGGYWISANADKIVAQPGTITGSIGVVGGKLANREAWAKAGITFDHVGFGENATFSLSQDRYTDSERARHTASLDTIYRDFTELVAEGRQLDLDHVHSVAKGRVWTGTQAKEKGLVDELGGLETAVSLAKQAAGIAADEPVSLVGFPKKKRPFPPERKESSEPIHQAFALLTGSLRNVIPAGIQLRMPDYRIR